MNKIFHPNVDELCVFKTNNEEWFKSAKPKLGPDPSNRVRAAIDSTHENMKTHI
ncbi:hypothetical protein ACE6H2_002061 [Prunus campanulata]